MREILLYDRVYFNGASLKIEMPFSVRVFAIYHSYSEKAFILTETK